ncbi:MAG TPA: hypothetical protein VGG29_03290 [Caulobacteraceae bacterium]|jgi:predicted transcriptional regulator
MPDDGVTIALDAALSARLHEAAEAAGQSPQELASALIAQGLDDRWAEAKASLAEYDRTGEYVDAETALADFRARLTERLDRAR